jgi:hypothetical protein
LKITYIHIKSILVFIILIFVQTLIVQAQPVGGIGDFYTEKHYKTGFNGFYNINSTAFTNQFYNYFVQGGYIENETKSKIENRLSGKNYLGADLNAGIYFSVRRQDSLKSNLVFFGGIRDVEHLDFSFNDDLFKLAMYGNTRYKGDTANFGSLRGQLLRYQKIEAGFFTPDKKLGIALAYLKGEQFWKADIPTALLYTSADASNISLNVAGNWQQSDTTNKKLLAFNGHGASLSVFYKHTFKEDESRFINVELNDLGFILWNNQSISRSFDTTYAFEGIVVNNLFSLSDTSFGEVNQDSIINRFSNSNKKAVTSFIPLSFHIAYYHKLNEKFSLVNGAIYKIAAQHIPYLYLQPQYHIGEHIKLIARIAYGGYGKVHFATGVKAKFADKWHLGLSIDNMEGYLFPKITGGQGLSIRFAKEF